MKRFRKILLILIFAVIVLGRITVEAEEKAYKIEEANFYIEAQDNGDVIVTETWKVEYKGEFSRFFKSFPPNDLNKLEEYEYLNIIDATINDKECLIMLDNDKRKDYIFTKSNGFANWYYHVKDKSVQYKVRYKITGLLKETNGDTVVLCYRPICYGFDKSIDNIEIVVSAPERSYANLRYINRSDGWSYKEVGNKLQISSNNTASTGLLIMNVAMDGNCFTKDLAYVSLDVIKEIEESNGEKRNSFVDDIILKESIRFRAVKRADLFQKVNLL